MNKGTEAIIVYGRSQMGKSTMIASVRARNETRSPAVGEGDGASCTRSAAAYETELGIVIDVPGWDDSDLRFEPHHVAQFASLEMVNHGITSVRIGLFESAVDSTNQLQMSMQNLHLGFGERITSSIFVIMTKIDKMTPRELEKKVRTMKKKMEHVNLRGEPFLWQGVGLDSAQMAEQINRLKRHVAKYPAITTAELDDLNSQIMKKAQELCENQVPQKKDHSFESSEVHDEKKVVVKVVPTIVNKTRQEEEDFQAIETATETYDDTVAVQRVVDVEEDEWVPYMEDTVRFETVNEMVENPDYDEGEEHGKVLLGVVTLGLSNLFTRREKSHKLKQKEEEVKGQVMKYRKQKKTKQQIVPGIETVQRQRQVFRPVVKKRMVTKEYQEIEHKKMEVEKIVPVARKVKKTTSVEVKLPVEHFIPKAREIVVEEARKRFMLARSSEN